MIYCYRKMRELRLTHLFFLHYALALIIGGAAIIGLFALGGGLQFYSVVVLCYMYTQPTFFLLRRMKMYEVRQEIKYGDYSFDKKIELVSEYGSVIPQLDKDVLIYIGLIYVNLFSLSVSGICIELGDKIPFLMKYIVMFADFFSIRLVLSFAKAPCE